MKHHQHFKIYQTFSNFFTFFIDKLKKVCYNNHSTTVLPSLTPYFSALPPSDAPGYGVGCGGILFLPQETEPQNGGDEIRVEDLPPVISPFCLYIFSARRVPPRRRSP